MYIRVQDTINITYQIARMLLKIIMKHALFLSTTCPVVARNFIVSHYSFSCEMVTHKFPAETAG